MPRTMEAVVHQVGPTTGQGSVRSHSVLIDRPVEKGGMDRGPQGGELLLLSLGGCFLSNLLAAAKARSAEVSDVHVTITAGVGGVPERVESMALRIRARYGDGDLMAKLVSIAERGCLVTNSLKPAMSISVTIEPSSAEPMA